LVDSLVGRYPFSNSSFWDFGYDFLPPPPTQSPLSFPGLLIIIIIIILGSGVVKIGGSWIPTERMVNGFRLLYLITPYERENSQ
jgi:hypothetical protein